MYVLLFAFVYIPGIFYITSIRARFTAVYAYMCDYSGIYVCMYV